MKIQHPALRSLTHALALLLLPLSLNSTFAQEIDAPVEKIFSGVRSTTSAAQAVVIRNTGTLPLQISSVAKVGANPTAFTLVNPPATPRSVPAGTSVTFNVTFTPAQSSAPSMPPCASRATMPTKPPSTSGSSVSAPRARAATTSQP